MTKRTAGFTLIELLVVTTIIAVLAVGAVISFTSAGKSARDGRRKSDLETVRQALVLYKSENGAYPTGAFSAATTTLISDGFLSSPAPTDPKGTGSYTYSYATSASAPYTTFCVCALMEGTGANSNAVANATCSGIGGASPTYYCVKQP